MSAHIRTGGDVLAALGLTEALSKATKVVITLLPDKQPFVSAEFFIDGNRGEANTVEFDLVSRNSKNEH